jgi:hypothetical protein
VISEVYGCHDCLDTTEIINGGRPRQRTHDRQHDAPWYYVSDDLASTVMLGPATDAEDGDDWILSFSAEGRTEEDRERVCARLIVTAVIIFGTPSRYRGIGR